jgi:hypothetical protein
MKLTIAASLLLFKVAIEGSAPAWAQETPAASDIGSDSDPGLGVSLG